MKKSILTLAVVILAAVAFGNSNNFEKLMKQNLKTLRDGSKSTSYKTLAIEFANIANLNQDRFEPLYYSAYCYIIGSWQVTNETGKLEILSKAKSQIDKALVLAPNNDEIIVLDAFYYQAMIMANPQKYGQSFSSIAGELLQRAQQLNNTNPRTEFLLAQNLYHRPVQYGGGKKVALPLFEKAASLYKQQNTKNYLLPIWGKDANYEMIKQCKL